MPITRIAFLALALFHSTAFAAATYRGVGTVHQESEADPETESIALPASAAAGDFQLLFITNTSTSVDVSVTNWTMIFDHTSAERLTVWCRINVMGDGAASVTFAGATSHATAWIASWHTDVPDDCSALTIESAETASGNGTTLPYPSLTVTNDNSLVLIFGWHFVDGTPTDPGDFNDEAGFAEIAESSTAGGNNSAAVANYVVQTTATNITGGTWDITGTWESAARMAVTMGIEMPAPEPTFTAAPTISNRTTSTIVTTFTSDTTGTVYSARLTDGSSAPTCDQLEAQTATGGVQYKTEAVTATVADGETFDSITDGTVTDLYFCIEDGSSNDSAVASIANAFKLPAFTVNPVVSAQDTNDYTINKTLDGAGTVFVVACLKDSTAPTVTQVENGDCTGNVDAIAAASDDATGTVTLGGSLTRPIHDIYAVGTYGSQHEAAVHALVDEFLDAPATCGRDGDDQCQFILLTSIAATSPCDAFNDVVTPDLVAGDIASAPTETNPDDFVLVVELDCDMNYEGFQTQQSAFTTFYDTSAGDWHAETAEIWFNNSPPSCTDTNVNLRVNTAVSRDIGALHCDDIDEDVLTVVEDTDPMITGMMFSAPDYEGTPTVVGEMGTGEYTVSDVPEDSDDLTIDYSVFEGSSGLRIGIGPRITIQ